MYYAKLISVAILVYNSMHEDIILERNIESSILWKTPIRNHPCANETLGYSMWVKQCHFYYPWLEMVKAPFDTHKNKVKLGKVYDCFPYIHILSFWVNDHISLTWIVRPAMGMISLKCIQMFINHWLSWSTIILTTINHYWYRLSHY